MTINVFTTLIVTINTNESTRRRSSLLPLNSPPMVVATKSHTPSSSVSTVIDLTSTFTDNGIDEDSQPLENILHQQAKCQWILFM
jgi:hypothetical protein